MRSSAISPSLNIHAPVIQAMLLGNEVLLDDPAFDQVLSGHGDVGTIVLKSDLTRSEKLLAAADRFLGHDGSFSEENDRRTAEGELTRTLHRNIFMFDPVDGSGDRARGAPGSVHQRGFTSLATYLEAGVPVNGYCLRPAYSEFWAFDRAGIGKFRIDPQGRLVKEVFERGAKSDETVIYVNSRPAYPDTNFPDALLERATKLSSGKYIYQWKEAGGAGDALVQLIAGELDIVTSGRKTDWKLWDTALFDVALDHIEGGRLSDYGGKSLRDTVNVRDQDLWHNNGVLAWAGADPQALNFFRAALEQFRTEDPSLVYLPSRK